MPLRNQVYWICLVRHISESDAALAPTDAACRATAELKS